MTNLPATIAEVKSRLAAAWRAEDEYEPAPLDVVHRLVMEKYSRDDWNRRR